MERIELVELIEWQKSKLSPRARELWDELDALIYLSDDDRTSPTQQEYEVMNRLGRLPRADKRGIGQLRQLRTGLYASDHAEGRGNPESLTG